MTNPEELLYALGQLLGGEPIDEIISVLIVMSARALFIAAGGDPEELAALIAKFANQLIETTGDMPRDPKETVQ